jgi:glucose/arabinose dehydrogenase
MASRPRVQILARLVAILVVAQLPGIAAPAASTAAQPSTIADRGTLERDGKVGTPLAVDSTPASGFQDTTALSGLVNPTRVAFAPDGRVFVAEKRGRIQVFDSLSDPTPTQWAALDTNVYNYWDRGLLGMWLSPGFGPAGSSYVYVLYTYDHMLGDPPGPRWNDACPNPPGATTDGCVASARLSRIPVVAGGGAGSEDVLVEDWCQQFPSHSIGTALIGPDGFLYAGAGEASNFNGGADYGQYGDPLNPCGDPPGGVGATLTPPTAEGGALRAQDVRTTGDPQGLDGSIIRVDPATGAAAPGNPNSGSSDANLRRIIAYGVRNPFRFTFRPGTSELWIGDVGFNNWEEIDRMTDVTPANPVNYGWPCWEGAGHVNSYDTANLDLCESLYTAGTAVNPYWSYGHSSVVVPGETCPYANGSVISGMAFYEGGPYPASFDGALFFADHSRNCIWAMKPATTGGLPSSSNISTLVAQAANPVDLVSGPNGDIFYVDFDGGTIHRITYIGSNNAPVADAVGSPLSGNAPLTVNFDGTGSSDSDGTIASYDWDFGDSSGHSSASTPSHTYTTGGTRTVTLTVTDNDGATDTDTLTVNVSNNAPVPHISTPSSSLRWTVGQHITFSGSATDAQDGTIPASGLSWRLIIDHCTELGCHQHIVQTWDGVASGSFDAPDHEYPSHLELELTAEDSDATTATTTISLLPKTVDLTFASDPSGAQLTVGSRTDPAPFTQRFIVGSRTTITTDGSQTIAGMTRTFSSWSDGGALTHQITAPSTARTYEARFSPFEPSNTCASAHSASTTSWINETIHSASDVDWYRFTVSSTHRVRVVLGDLSGDARVDLYSSCSNLLQSSQRTGSGFEQLYRKLPAGTYRVKVSGVGGASGPYALRFQILSNSLTFVTRTGWHTGSTVVFAGEIINNDSSIRRSILVHATLYNASNQKIGERSGHAYTYGLVSGGTAPYRLAFAEPAGYDHAVMSMTSSSTSTAPVGGLTVLMGTKYTDGSGYHVPGTVRNTNAFTVDTTRVAIALYDSRGAVMNAVRVSPSSTTLGPGKSASYHAVFSDHYTGPELISRRAMANR